MTEERCKELLSLYLANIKYKKAYTFKALNREDYTLGVTLHVCGVICESVAFNETTILFMQEEDFFDYFIMQIVKILELLNHTSEDIKQNLKLISDGQEILIFKS